MAAANHDDYTYDDDEYDDDYDGNVTEPSLLVSSPHNVPAPLPLKVGGPSIKVVSAVRVHSCLSCPPKDIATHADGTQPTCHVKEFQAEAMAILEKVKTCLFGVNANGSSSATPPAEAAAPSSEKIEALYKKAAQARLPLPTTMNKPPASQEEPPQKRQKQSATTTNQTTTTTAQTNAISAREERKQALLTCPLATARERLEQKTDPGDGWLTGSIDRKAHGKQRSATALQQTVNKQYETTPVALGNGSSGSSDSTLIPGKSVLVRVGVHSAANPSRVSQELLLPANMPLDALRRAVVCPSDDVARVMSLGAGDLAPGALVRINDELVPATCGPCVDYAKPLLEYAESHFKDKRSRGPAWRRAARPLEEYTFADVVDGLHRGAHFVAGYVHAGACEHRLSIVDTRLVHEDDELDFGAYPLEVMHERDRRRKCMCCLSLPAVTVSWCDRRAPDAPTFWCEECFSRLHQNPDGSSVDGVADMATFPYFAEPVSGNNRACK
ncbi:snRNA-activating protein complex subunit 3 [Pseudoscourfieldia marina]